MRKFNFKLKTLFVFVLLIESFVIGLSINTYGFDEIEEINEIRKKVRDNIFLQLDLTLEQNKQIKKQHKEFDLNAEKRVKELIIHKKYFMEELKKQDADLKKINDTSGEIKRLGGELFDLKIESVLSLKKTLTPEQFEKLLELRKKAKNLANGLRGLIKRRMQGLMED